jgi:hypothetical protein
MTVPVRATPSQVAEANPPSGGDENVGSYPAEITRDQFVWLHERAATRRLEWAEHARNLACNQKS